jgi:hypothetical protein
MLARQSYQSIAVVTAQQLLDYDLATMLDET